jgi:hypothetical protein
LIAAGALAALLVGVACPVRAAPPPPGSSWQITDPGQGPVALRAGGTRARELSGITWVEGTRYLAVSDRDPMLYPLTIELNAQTGAIARATLGRGVPLAGSRDLEGIAVDRTRGTVLVSDEDGPAIREYDPNSGALIRSLSLPAVFKQARNNLSLESLSFSPDGRALWTANEEALAIDGPRASDTTGSIVRLQRFDREFRPDGQWAYRTDPALGVVRRGARDLESSGVSDLVALPGGGLLVLERAFGAGGFRNRVYEVDFHAATDVGARASLAAMDDVAVGKRLLWEHAFFDINYEGAALGPPLAGGGWSLVLIADDGHHLRQALYALVVRR